MFRDENLFSIEEAARYLKVSILYIRYLRVKNKLSAEKSGRSLLFHRKDLDQYLLDKRSANSTSESSFTVPSGKCSYRPGEDKNFITVDFLEQHTYQECCRFLGGRRRVPLSDFIKWIKNRNY